MPKKTVFGTSKPIKWLFTADLNIEYRTVQVARGAAYCVAQTRTVTEFFANGAALGVQILENPARNNLWEDTAVCVFSKVRSAPLTLVTM